jgi:hypothetical protein
MARVAQRAPYSCFTDKTREPRRLTVRRALADARSAWDGLEGHLAEAHGLRGSLHFMYAERYGWALRFDRGGRLVLAMYPGRGHLTVQIILSRAQIASAIEIGMPSHAWKAFDAATDYLEGRWLFIRVRSPRSAEALKPLIALKLARPKARRARGQLAAGTRAAG